MSDPLLLAVYIVCFIVLVGILLLLARALINREQNRADRLDAEVTRLNSLIQDKTIPAIIEGSAATRASTGYLQNLQYQRDLGEVAERRSKLITPKDAAYNRLQMSFDIMNRRLAEAQRELNELRKGEDPPDTSVPARIHR